MTSISRHSSLGRWKGSGPSDDTQRIQEGHITAGHIFCELVEKARSMEIGVIVMTGKGGGKLGGRGDVNIMIPSDDTQRIQEGHITAGHIFCELVEQAFEPGA